MIPSGERLVFTMCKSRETTAANETAVRERMVNDFKIAKPGIFARIKECAGLAVLEDSEDTQPFLRPIYEVKEREIR